MSNNSYDRIAKMFSVLGNSNRLRIFLKLISCCSPGTVCTSTDAEMTACVGELGKDLNIAQSTLSHHIKELNASGLIRMERRGQKIACWVDEDVYKELSSFFSDHGKDT